MSYKEAV